MKIPCFIQLGTNKGNKKENLAKAREFIGSKVGSVVQTSGIYETEPWGCDEQATFLNQILKTVTSLEPLNVLEICLGIEQNLGRVRTQNKYEARPIDIDILFFDNQIISSDRLIIPHPRLHLRKFVLIPLKEIAPNLIHPEFNKSISELLENCDDSGWVKKILP